MWEDNLKKVIIECSSNIDDIQITNSTNLIDDLKYDSMNIMQLIVELEEMFNFEFDDEDLNLEKISSYEKIKSIIESKVRDFHV